MARTTPNRGWPYPDFEENPYDTTIVSTFEAMDSDVHTALTASGSRAVVDVHDFGAVGDGTTNDTPAIQAAINSLGTLGGTVVLWSTKKYLIDTALNVKEGITLLGQHEHIGGTHPDSLTVKISDLGSQLIVNSAVVIDLQSSAGLRGIVITRKGMTIPATNSSAYVGTAVYSQDTYDCFIDSCLIVGFARGVWIFNCARSWVNRVSTDCVTGFDISGSYDVTRVTNCHCWAFGTYRPSPPDPDHWKRNGTALKLHGHLDGLEVSGFMEFGWFTGIEMGPSAEIPSAEILGAQFHTVWLDANNWTGSRGLVVGTGVASCTFSDVKVVAVGTGVLYSAQAGARNTFIGCDTVICGTGWEITGGDFGIHDCRIDRCTGDGVKITGMGFGIIDNVQLNGITGQPINLTVAKPTTDLCLGQIVVTDKPAGTPIIGSNLVHGTLTAAATLALPINGETFSVSGTTTITNITGGWAGRRITLRFTGSGCRVTPGGTLMLSRPFESGTGFSSTLTLMHDGIYGFVEAGRSVEGQGQRYVWAAATSSSAITATGLQTFSLSHTLPAGVLNVLGAVIRIRLGGKMTTAAGTTAVFFAILLGGSYVGGSAAVPTAASLSNVDWAAEVTATIRASSTIFPHSFYSDLGLQYWNTPVTARQAPYTATLTGALVVGAQVNWAAASQSMTITDFLIEVLHPGP